MNDKIKAAKQIEDILWDEFITIHEDIVTDCLAGINGHIHTHPNYRKSQEAQALYHRALIKRMKLEEKEKVNEH